MNLHGVPRMTMDVDLVLAMEDAYLDAFLACARALGLKPQAPVPIEALKDPAQRRQWIETKNVIAFARGAPDASGATVDILIHHALDIDAAMAAASTRDVDGVPVRLCAVDDMILIALGYAGWSLQYDTGPSIRAGPAQATDPGKAKWSDRACPGA